ncbi:MAG: hypothetical protein OIF57_10445 [Marinobacterium sp.]|nr:hypothetical protein [Marinobacterium sp.]
MSKPLVVISQNTMPYRAVAQAMEQSYGQSVHVISLENLRHQPELLAPGVDMTIAVGAVATEYLLKSLPLSQRLLACYLPRRRWQLLWRQHGDRWLQRRDQLSVLYMEQPMLRQVALARHVLPEARILGTVQMPDTQLQSDLEEAARQYHFTLLQRTLTADSNRVRQLQPLIRDSDIFMPAPDAALFNRTTAKWLLYISYRQRVPLIGFSRAYVEAGAVAGVYSTSAQFGRQCGELLQRYNRKADGLPPELYPRYFTVSTNRAALRSLHLRLPPDKQLMSRLKEVQP